MIIGYLLLGSIAGLLASAITLLLGGSFWLAVAMYTLLSSGAVMLIPALRALTRVILGPKYVTEVAGPPNSVCLSTPTVSTIDRTGPTADGNMRILAVDDDPFILELIPKISAKAGFNRVVAADSGESALELICLKNSRFDCFLLDISMPGISGIELCRRIRDIPQYMEAPIVMLTAMRDMRYVGAAYRAGATDFVNKPFEIQDFGMRLRLAQEAITTALLHISDARGFTSRIHAVTWAA